MSLERSSKCYKRDGHLYLDSIKQNFNDGVDGIGGKEGLVNYILGTTFLLS
jgi:hypothetical protein